MGAPLEPLPLFPLPTVLFPYAQFRLHIFEERYRALMRYCAENDTGFGIVLQRRGAGPDDTYMVGVGTRIVQSESFQDSTMDVQIVAERRIRVRRVDDESHPFLMGYVENLPDQEADETPRLHALRMKVREYLYQYLSGQFAKLDMKVADIQFHDDPTVFSFQVAGLLHTDEEQAKQLLLELTDPIERLKMMVPMLERQILEADPGPHRKLTPEDIAEWITNN